MNRNVFLFFFCKNFMIRLPISWSRICIKKKSLCYINQMEFILKLKSFFGYENHRMFLPHLWMNILISLFVIYFNFLVHFENAFYIILKVLFNIYKNEWFDCFVVLTVISLSKLVKLAIPETPGAIQTRWLG